MRALQFLIASAAAIVLNVSRAHAVQIGPSSASIDRFFMILEQYVLPLMVVSTIVLFCGYLASRIFHRRVAHRQDRTAAGYEQFAAPEDETEAFLRELKATPPIEDSAARHEPKIRTTHPLLRRRQTASKTEGVPTPQEEALPEKARSTSPSARDTSKDIDNSKTVEARPEPVAEKGKEDRDIPPLRAAFLRPRQKPVDRAAPKDSAGLHARHEDAMLPVAASEATMAALPENATPERQSPVPVNRLLDEAQKPSKPLKTSKPMQEEHVREEPRLSAQPTWRGEDDAGMREEPTVSVVHGLKSGSAVAEAAKARASQIVDSLDYIASELQQSSVLLIDRLENKQGLSLDDVRRLRVDGYDEPRDVLDELRTLGGDAAQEVLDAFEAVARFNNVVQRLQQMAQPDPLDEGWNDLIRTRISDTLYAVGQVRKTLGIYRRTVKKPANTGTAS